MTRTRVLLIMAVVFMCAFAVMLSGCGENPAAEANINTFETFVAEQAHGNAAITDKKVNVNQENNGIISYAILETENGNNDRMITLAIKDNDPTLIEMKLYAVNEGEVEELDSEEFNLNDDECFGGEYDFFVKHNNGVNYLFIKRVNVVDSDFLYCEGLLYEIDEGFGEQLDAKAGASMEEYDFLVNDGEVTDVLCDEMTGEIPANELKEAFASWAGKSNSYVNAAGLSFKDDYYDVNSYAPLVEAIPNYDENDKSEKHLCFIRKGNQKDGKVKDFSDYQKSEYIEINDFTGVADLSGKSGSAETTEDKISLYEPILGEYRNLVCGGKLDTDIMTEEESGFEEGSRGVYLDEDGFLDGAFESEDEECLVDLYYTFYDINKDGTDELLVAEFWDRDGEESQMSEFFYPAYYSIWTLNGDEPENLFWGAERFNRYSILEDGTIANMSSSGAYTGSYEFYKIDNDLNIEMVAGAGYDLDWDNAPEDAEDLEDSILYYPNSDCSGEPSKAGYDEILNKYLSNPVKSLQDKSNWTKMF